MNPPPKFIVGSVEYLKAQVTSDEALTSADTVEIKVGGTWRTAEWVGSEGLTRVARVLVDFADISVGSHQVYVRLTDSDEVPLLDAGRIAVEAEKAS